MKSQKGEWLTDKKVDILVQLSMKKLPEIADVPLATELAKTKDQKDVLDFVFGEQTMGKPFMMAPGVPNDRLLAVREAFMKAAADEDAIAEMSKMGLGLSPSSGEELQQLVAKMYATPQAVIDRASDAVVSQAK